MVNNHGLSIIDTDGFKGIIGSSKVLTRELLEGIIDFIELSSRKETAETEKLVREADTKNSWLSLKEIRKFSKKK